MRKLERDFYKQDTLKVARELLGKYLVHNINGEKLMSKIVEVEAYKGPGDKAAHSYGGRRTARNEVMYGEAGYVYVFIIYGFYNCVNFVTAEPGKPEAILLRAVEPVEGLERMAALRFGKVYDELSKREVTNLTNGPGKLCIAMEITREHNGLDLCGEEIYILEDDNREPFEIVETKRVNIDYAEEATDYPWRYYIKGNRFVSKR